MWMARAVYEFGTEALSRGWGEGSTILDLWDQPGGLAEQVHAAMTSAAMGANSYEGEDSGGEE